MPYEKAKIIRMPINSGREGSLEEDKDDRPIKPSPRKNLFGDLNPLEFSKNLLSCDINSKQHRSPSKQFFVDHQ